MLFLVVQSGGHDYTFGFDCSFSGDAIPLRQLIMNIRMTLPVIPVAVGILYRQDGCILLASRPADKPWPGYWEFPGGKIEAGESGRDALARELDEELGIQVTAATPWLTLRHDYPTASVRLQCFLVREWRGEPAPREGQTLCWQSPGSVTVSPMVPAILDLLRALRLPPVMGITQAGDDPDGFLPRLTYALEGGLKLVQLREIGLAQRETFARAVVESAHRHGAQVVVNSEFALAQRVQADGVHLTASQLGQLAARPDFALVGASCHHAAELDQAERIGCDYALLSPVWPTASHPGAVVLGWQGFADLTCGRALPVYALGGMRHELLSVAQQHGAHGIALLRGAWQ